MLQKKGKGKAAAEDDPSAPNLPPHLIASKSENETIFQRMIRHGYTSANADRLATLASKTRGKNGSVGSSNKGGVTDGATLMIPPELNDEIFTKVYREIFHELYGDGGNGSGGGGSDVAITFFNKPEVFHKMKEAYQLFGAIISSEIAENVPTETIEQRKIRLESDYNGHLRMVMFWLGICIRKSGQFFDLGFHRGTGRGHIAKNNPRGLTLKVRNFEEIISVPTTDIGTGKVSDANAFLKILEETVNTLLDYGLTDKQLKETFFEANDAGQLVQVMPHATELKSVVVCNGQVGSFNHYDAGVLALSCCSSALRLISGIPEHDSEDDEGLIYRDGEIAEIALRIKSFEGFTGWDANNLDDLNLFYITDPNASPDRIILSLQILGNFLFRALVHGLPSINKEKIPQLVATIAAIALKDSLYDVDVINEVMPEYEPTQVEMLHEAIRDRNRSREQLKTITPDSLVKFLMEKSDSNGNPIMDKLNEMTFPELAKFFSESLETHPVVASAMIDLPKITPIKEDTQR
jgi:hypothetical protein